MKEVETNTNLIAACGLYCGACKAYLKNRCPGCRLHKKADKWCKVKLCCRDNTFTSCADCQKYNDLHDCKKFNNIFSKIFAFIFGSNRKWCIDRIRQIGYEGYAKEASSSKNYNGKNKK